VIYALVLRTVGPDGSPQALKANPDAGIANDYCLVGPFPARDAATAWCADPRNNPGDDPRWWVLDLDPQEAAQAPELLTPDVCALDEHAQPGLYALRFYEKKWFQFIGPFDDVAACAAWCENPRNNLGLDSDWQTILLSEAHIGHKPWIVPPDSAGIPPVSPALRWVWGATADLNRAMEAAADAGTIVRLRTTTTLGDPPRTHLRAVGFGADGAVFAAPGDAA
jgi:hypothetical protein